MTSSHCIFCEIVARRSPASFVYSDDHISAFMDVQPVRAGQTLIIPNQHLDHFSDVADDVAVSMLICAQRMSRKIQNTLHPLRVGLVVHGFGVAHAHLIVVPQWKPDDIASAQYAYMENDEIKFSIKRLPFATREELDRLAEQLRVESLIRQ